uniref:Nudix hydrolase domain-containing protein n=1 Tax=Timspurckia oligopyrenoides TaxID=708627 RepID=A0A6T6P3X6_9RHOD
MKESVLFSRFGRVIERVVRYPNGAEHSFDIWTKNWRNENEFAIVLPFYTHSQSVMLVREYYPAPHRFHWGLPAGNVEKLRHGSALNAAKSELQEEAALCGGQWYELLQSSRGMAQDKYQMDWSHLYLCVNPEDQSDGSKAQHEDEELIERHMVPLQRLRELAIQGEFQANQTACVLLALEKIRELGLSE